MHFEIDLKERAAHDTKDMSKAGLLYRIRSETQKAVKVGFAVDIGHRMHSIKSGNPAKLDLIESVGCTADGEKMFHRMFRPHKTYLEWYPDGDLIEEFFGEAQSWITDRATEKARATGGVTGDQFRQLLDDEYLTSEDIEEIAGIILEEWQERVGFN